MGRVILPSPLVVACLHFLPVVLKKRPWKGHSFPFAHCASVNKQKQKRKSSHTFVPAIVPVSHCVMLKEGRRVGLSLLLCRKTGWEGANHVSMNKKKSCGHTFVPTSPCLHVASVIVVYYIRVLAMVDVWSERWNWKWRSEGR